jgi:hypothetical protein
MSGTGKSTALMKLEKRGFQVVDTDEPPWSEWCDEDGGYVWREDVIEELLATPRRSACPPAREEDDERLRQDGRRTPAHAQPPSEVEPLLRATCTHEIDATQPIPDVVAQLVDIGRATSAAAGA